MKKLVNGAEVEMSPQEIAHRENEERESARNPLVLPTPRDLDAEIDALKIRIEALEKK